jgi:tetratricopeptide (TPR) repeat protein
MAQPTDNLLTGRWQIPLALVAAIAGSVALYRLIPSAPDVDFDALMADVAVLENSGDTLAAADAVANLLEMDPPLPPAQRAELHDRLADLVFQAERGAAEHSKQNIDRLRDHDRAARDLGWPATPQAALRDAYASLWLGQEEAALRGLRSVLEQELPVDDRRAAMREVADLLDRKPEARQERQHVLNMMLADENLSSGYLWWALRRAVRDRLDEGDTVQAERLLERHADRLSSSNLRGYLDYLRAWVKLYEGRPEEAAPLAHWVDQWLGEAASDHRDLDRFGHLPSLNRWLMGRVNLALQRPQDALEEFDAALDYKPEHDLYVAATVGRGLALGALDRHAAALDAFRSAVERLRAGKGRKRHAIAEFQQALLQLFEQRRALGDFASALEYLGLAAELTPEDDRARQLELYEGLGQAYAEAASRVDDPERQREYHEQAGRNLERAAERVAYDEPHLAALLWAAASEYDQAGRIGGVRRMLKQFVSGRSDDPRMPQALLQLGRAHEAYGELNDARELYERLIDDYPRLEEATRAKVLMAGILLSMGPEKYAEAERILADLLTAGDVAPDAAMFRDALLTLCELLYYQGRYAEAIGRLEDLLKLYPHDPEHFRSRFMLADAYRRSAYALRETAREGGSPAAERESDSRFRAATDLYGELLADLEKIPALDQAQRLYTRLALFYRADCLFELNTPETLQDALTAYRNAAARYDGEPAALTAQVQIANVFLRLGNVTEAARAVERARWLVRTIPRESYTPLYGGSPDEWERFISVVMSSALFRDVFSGAP